VPERLPSARELLTGLVGRTISTVTGRRNSVLAVEDAEVIVATGRSPAGQRVTIDSVQAALGRLETEGEIEISVPSLGHRSAFVGAVLLTLPAARATTTSPPRIRLDADLGSSYRARMAGELSIWWQDDRAQRFWLEITDRPDIGVDLHCPQRDASGHRTPGYSLIWWVRRDDVVFHYDKNQSAITAWSRAVGKVVEAPVVWLSHRGATRRRLGSAQAQPGWWVDLEGPYLLNQPLTLTQLRAQGAVVRAVMDGQRERVSGAVYFPFFFYGGRDLRPMQPYLNKLPAELVAALPELADGARSAALTEPLIGSASPSDSQIGDAYRPAAVSSLPDARDPFSVDPAVVERGLRGHADTQNALAAAVTATGMTPRSPRSTDPNFDLAWEGEDKLFVAEVKSTTTENEERQLRLGLGQVLRYRNVLARRGRTVTAVLVPERSPQDSSWQALCDELGVVLAAGPHFEALRLESQ
jgi:hypothetical protein